MEMTESVKKYFSGDVFATQTVGIAVEYAREDSVRCVLDIQPKHLNANGMVMGGVILTLADFAFAVATNDGEKNASVTLSSGMEFLNAARGGRLTAQTSFLKSGRSTCTVEVTVRDDAGVLIAKATTVGLKIKK